MDTFLEYDIKHPNLIIDILKYFESKTIEYISGMENKSVADFCMSCGVNEKTNYIRIQAGIVIRICEILCENHIMTKLQTGTWDMYNNYLFMNNKNISLDPESSFHHYLNSIIYGFRYIYRKYRDIVIPIICEFEKEQIALGTGFKFLNGIATAKHCIEGAKSIAFKDFHAKELINKPVYISRNPNIDIAFINTGKPTADIGYREAEIMEEVLAMGYPMIPGFTDFLTAEKATIASKAESRITPSTGSIVAIAKDIFSKLDLFLITAKIRGGNSGGPIIAKDGKIVGIACRIPISEGNYDDLGYGVATPISELIKIITEKHQLDISKTEFKDFG